MAKPQIKGRGFIGSGQEIIETQTYYTQPEKDWEFDEDQLLTYNNPVFAEQCKIRGKDFDALNTGWVKQKKIGEPDEEMDEPEDLEDEDDLTEDEEEDLFEDEDDEFDDDDDEIVIKPPTSEPPKEDKSKDNKSDDLDLNKKDDAPVPEKPEVSASDLDAIFGVEDRPAAPTADAQPAKPKLKLNIKPPTAPTAQPSAKPGNIKLNLKNKPKT